jgi:hypothetical protein
VADQDLAVAQHGHRTAGAGIGSGQGGDGPIEASGKGAGHGGHSRPLELDGQARDVVGEGALENAQDRRRENS